MNTDKEVDFVLTTLEYTPIDSYINSVKQSTELANNQVAAVICISAFKNSFIDRW